MKVIKAFPPNYDAICAKFDIRGKTNINFCYGDVIYSPGSYTVSADLMIHETVHSEQQAKKGVETWWKMYLDDDQFRLEQEVEAYRAQYQFVCNNYQRGARRKFLKVIAKDLSSEIYGYIVNFDRACDLIKGVSNV